MADDRVPAAAWPIDPRSGEPRRPALAWAGGGLLFGAAALVIGALLLVMWDSVRRFPEASRLNRVIVTELGDPIRILLVLGDFAIGLIVAIAAVVAGFYGWAGYRWARWAGLLAVALAGGTFALNWLAPLSLVPLALGAACWWLPPVRRYSAAWHAHRHPVRSRAEAPTPGSVVYGPLPRYR